MSTGTNHIGSTPNGRGGDNAEYSRKEAPMDMASAAARRGRGRMKRLILAVTAAAGLLAFCAPVAAQASARPTAVPRAAWSVGPATRAATAQGLVVGALNPYTAVTYHLAAPYAGCTFSVGDRYEGSGGAAVGMAVASCPSARTFRILVYLDYETTSGGQYTWRDNVNGTPYYTYNLSVSTGCGRNLDANYTTYAKISIDNSPYSGYFESGYEKAYNAGPNCP